MNKGDWLILGGGLLALILLSMSSNWLAVANAFVPTLEGFRSTPYWDVNAWRWGYGTPAPGPSGSITRAQALVEMDTRLKSDYDYLSSLVTRPLSSNRWAALLAFSYNVGKYSADNLVANINAGDEAALETQWKKYVYSDGVVNDTLIDRRAREWDMWQS